MTKCRSKDAAISGFGIAGAAHVFIHAIARIEGQTVFVVAPGVPAPLAVRYARASCPAAPLYGGAGLPAALFHSGGLENKNHETRWQRSLKV